MTDSQRFTQKDQLWETFLDQARRWFWAKAIRVDYQERGLAVPPALTAAENAQRGRMLAALQDWLNA